VVETAVRLTVKAKPRASRSRVLRCSGLSIEVALAAPPVDGAANDELIRLLSEALDLPKRALTLVLGQTSKQKVIEVTDLAVSTVVERLTAAAGH
jgi:uncharacterized protein